MGTHQHDKNAVELWQYFVSVIDWIEKIFTTKRSFMKDVDWGTLYNEFKDKKLNAVKTEKKTAELILDDDVKTKSGIYSYILTRNEKYFSIRAFSNTMK